MNLRGVALLPLYLLFTHGTLADHLFPDIGPVMVKCGDHQCDQNAAEYCNDGIDKDSPHCERCSNTYGRQHVVRDPKIANERCPLYIIMQKMEDAQRNQAPSTQGTEISTVVPDCEDQQGLSKTKISIGIVLAFILSVVVVSSLSVGIIWCCLDRKYKWKMRKGHDGEQWTCFSGLSCCHSNQDTSNAETMSMLDSAASNGEIPMNLCSSNDRTRQRDDEKAETTSNHLQTPINGISCSSNIQHDTSENGTIPTPECRTAYHNQDTSPLTNRQINNNDDNTSPKHTAQPQTGHEHHNIGREDETCPKRIAQSQVPQQCSSNSPHHSSFRQEQQSTRPSTEHSIESQRQSYQSHRNPCEPGLYGHPVDDSQDSNYPFNFMLDGTTPGQPISGHELEA